MTTTPTPELTASEYFANVKNKDQQAFENWKASGSKKDLGILMGQLGPIVYAEVKRQSGSLPTAALSAEAKKWAYKGIQTYDPSKGTAISTHVMNYLQRVRRVNYKYQNAVRLPENMQLKYHDYNKTLVDLTDELNREPTDEEMAKKIGWSKPQVVKFKNSLYNDLIESNSERASEFTQFNTQSIFMEHLMSQLDYQEKFILENSKLMSSAEMVEKLGLKNLNRLNYLKSNLVSKIEKIQQESGMM